MARKHKTRSPYLMVSAPTWELARAAYLGGETAKQVAARLKIGVHNLRRKIHEESWSKRKLADARAGVLDDPAGSQSSPPKAAAPEGVRSETDLMETVLTRARAALTAGRGSEATALLKATREYVIARQDIADARAAIARAVKVWDAAQPARAGELTEVLMVQTLHPLWAGLTPEEEADRADPGGAAGLGGWMAENAPPAPKSDRRAR